MITWALFRWQDGAWEFAGFTPHDEIATEFQEQCDLEADEPIPCAVLSLEDPPRLDHPPGGAVAEGAHAAERP